MSGTIRVQPLLTPDNYPQAVFDLIKGAKRRLWIQNQYINLNPQGDLPEFKRIINLLLKKIETQPDLDVRIICRNLMAPGADASGSPKAPGADASGSPKAPGADASGSPQPEFVSFGEGAPPPPGDKIYVNGLNAVTGEPLVPPLTLAELAQVVLRGAAPLPAEVRSSAAAANFRQFGLPDAVDADDIRQAGWGVVVPAGRDDLFERIKPLWNHRAKTVPADRLKRLTYNPGERCRDWLRRHGMAYGSQLPTVVPYHLLLLGTPVEISFGFQYLLDLEYSVGRLSFTNDADWTRYCEAVVKTETEGSLRKRNIAWFAPRHDPATNISHDELVLPLTKEDPSGLTSLSGYESVPLLAANATRAKLFEALNEAQPAFLFTASHGLGLPQGHAQQAALQGALVTSDWPKNGPVGEDHCLAGQHIQSDVRGMVAFLFACFGAGTPREDDYPMDLAAPRQVLADAPFVAALPQALLANGALAVLGHVDRAWGCSIRPAAVKQRIGPFRNMVDRILRGRCIGNATRDFSDRSAVLSQELLDMVAPGGMPIDDESLVYSWVERNDARSYILLGDPAVRLGRYTSRGPD